jgi:hypothetical protein
MFGLIMSLFMTSLCHFLGSIDIFFHQNTVHDWLRELRVIPTIVGAIYFYNIAATAGFI